jgi:hypothetical protein
MNLKTKKTVKKEFETANLVLMLILAIIAITTTTIVYAASSSDTSTPDEAAHTTAYVETTTAHATEAVTTVESTTEPVTDVVETKPHKTEDTDVEESAPPIAESNKAPEEHNESSNHSDYELDLLARTIYQEAGICSEYCQWLVGSTVLNLADERGGIEAVVFDYNTFNVSYKLYNATPSNLSYSVASRLLSGDRDYRVKAFRTDYYHSFGTPYTSTDNVYFSTY